PRQCDRGSSGSAGCCREASRGDRCSVPMSTATEELLLAQDNPLVEGLERLPVHPTVLVIFGATGDLAHRKLLPALYNLAHEGALPERFELIGVAPRGQSKED